MDNQKKEVIKKLYISGSTPTEIAKVIEEKVITVRKCIERNFKDEFYNEHLENKTMRKEDSIIKEYYVQGDTAKEIAKKILGSNENTIKIYIDRNFKDKYYRQHLESRNARKEVKRALNHSSNKYMGRSQIIDWCNNAYESDKKGNRKFREGIGICPMDLPRYVSSKIAVI